MVTILYVLCVRVFKNLIGVTQEFYEKMVGLEKDEGVTSSQN